MAGKFESEMDRAIWELSLDGGPDEEVGSSSEAPGTWAGIMRDGNAIADALKQELSPGALRELREIGSAGVILTEDTQGFVQVDYYEDEHDLERAWRALEEELSIEDDFEENRRRRGTQGRMRRNRMSKRGSSVIAHLSYAIESSELTPQQALRAVIEGLQKRQGDRGEAQRQIEVLDHAVSYLGGH